MELSEKTLSSSQVFDGRLLKVYLDQVGLANGDTAIREFVHHPGGAAVVALDGEGNVYLERQFRYPYKKVLLELPAGKLEPGEDPFEAVKREQLEETGTRGDNYISLGEVYPTPGYCGEIIRLWACRAAEGQQELSLDEDEFLDTERIPLDRAVEMVCNNEIPDAKTQIGILKTAFLIKNGLI